MNVGKARAAARAWIIEHGQNTAGYRGAWFSGSTVQMPDEASLPASSDVDVMVVLDVEEVPVKPGKFIYEGALLEITFVPFASISSMELVLSSYHLAGGFRTDSILDDPTGFLHSLQEQVAIRFSDEFRVRARCGEALARVGNGMSDLDFTAPLQDRVTSWLFPAGVTTHVLLVAALRNPTIRLRYLAVREVMGQYGLEERYEELLQLSGWDSWTPQMVRRHLAGLERTFDEAARYQGTLFPFRSDITLIARPVIIDGSRVLIRAGNHREAAFWMAATYARCHKILAADAPTALQRELMPAFESILSDMGVLTEEGLKERARAVTAYLPRLRDSMERILAGNDEIKRH
jgi:hypothetical protein